MMPIRYVVDSSPDNSAKETNKIMVLVRTRLVLLINSPYSVKLSFVAKIIYFIISFLLSLSSHGKKSVRVQLMLLMTIRLIPGFICYKYCFPSAPHIVVSQTSNEPEATDLYV